GAARDPAPGGALHAREPVSEPISAHRLRSGFARARVQPWRARLPFVLRTTSEPFGERGRVWCPAGTSAEDLRAAPALLRPPCWAADVRTTPDERHRPLATIDVIRKGPLCHGSAAPDAASARGRYSSRCAW